MTQDPDQGATGNDDGKLYFNGINGVTGEYVVPPMTPEQLGALAKAAPCSSAAPPQPPIAGLEFRPPAGVPEDDISKAGWGIVLPEDTGDDVKHALQPLIDQRARAVKPDRLKVLTYRKGEQLHDWLLRQGVSTGNISPTKVPYYLLLVGPPTSIPFEFQYLLGIQYRVGRVAFAKPEEYAQYAASVVAYETAPKVPHGKEIAFWGTAHAGDRATQLSANYLVKPLVAGIDGDPDYGPVGDDQGFRRQVWTGKDATKDRILHVLRPDTGAPPALLFTASHGMQFPKGHALQIPSQGALLCQDWPGFGQVAPRHYLSATDIPDDARVHGLVALCFACFAAGTPDVDQFVQDRSDAGTQALLADAPFVSSLPQRLLSHRGGGALAVIGHIDRAWGFSIKPLGAEALGPQIQPFRDTLTYLMSGKPVGFATIDFSDKYAALAAQLAADLDPTNPGEKPSDRDFVMRWMERNDAQNYVLLGDPAVRLRVGELA
jgi:hypothetical protein